MKHIIISIGELLWDLLPDRTILGGAPANLAFRLNELGEDCFLVSRLGKDQFGEQAVQKLKSIGLPVSLIQWDDKFPTGTVVVSFDEHKNPDYIITSQTAFDRIEITKELEDLAEKSHCIAFGTLAQRAEISRSTIAELIKAAPKAIKFLDVNLRKDCFTLDSINVSLQYADILKANHHEVLHLNSLFKLNCNDIPSVCKEISERYEINTILVTMEEMGVFLFDHIEGEHYIPGYRIPLEDPLGAGDAFSAGFLHALLNGKSLKDASEAGNLLGATVATKKGAINQLTQGEIHIIAKENNRINDPYFVAYCGIHQ